MVEDFSELELNKAKTDKDIDLILKEKLNISLVNMVEKISSHLKLHVDDICSEFLTLAPFGEYSKLLETPEDIKSFILDNSDNYDNWKLVYAQINDTNHALMEFVFNFVAANDGEEIKGYAYLGKSGKIRHAFAQAE
jgi:hypothetical protein